MLIFHNGSSEEKEGKLKRKKKEEWETCLEWRRRDDSLLRNDCHPPHEEENHSTLVSEFGPRVFATEYAIRSRMKGEKRKGAKKKSGGSVRMFVL